MPQHFGEQLLSRRVSAIASALVLAFGALLASSGLAFGTDDSWEGLPGSATHLAIGANGAAWAIGSERGPGGYSIHRWRGLAWERMAGGAVRVAVKPDGDAWVVNDRGDIYQWSTSGWRQVDGRATDIAIGAGGHIWILGATPVRGGYAIYRRDGYGWTQFPGGAVRIAVDPHGNPWILNSEDRIYRWIGAWSPLPGLAKELSIGADGTVYAVGTERARGGHRLQSWNERVGWQKERGSAATLAVGPSGEVWTADAEARIHRFNSRSNADLLDAGGGRHDDKRGNRHKSNPAQYCTEQPPTQCTCVWERCQLEMQGSQSLVTLGRGDSREIASSHPEGFYLRWKRNREGIARASNGWSCTP